MCDHRLTEGSKKAGLSPNINYAGAWRTLDSDLSGYISIKEFDERTSEILMEFKIWADEHFGGLKPGFRVLDTDNSGGLSFKEFKRMFKTKRYKAKS